jgi:diguanylate cyclase (GGDEF)-like protein
MPAAPLPVNEDERLRVLRGYDLLGGIHDAGLDAICRVTAAIFGTPIALVSISDAHRQFLAAGVGLDAEELARDIAPCSYAILDTEPFVIADAAHDARFADNPLVTGPFHMRFYAGAPLRTSQGHALGTLCAIGSEPQAPRPEDLAKLVDLGRAVMAMFEMRRAMVRARELAMTDVQTGLANRAGLLLELERVMEERRRDAGSFALLYFDVDNFKYVNDTRGHAAGDDVLRAVAEALTESAGSDAFASRIGGDEFVVVMRHANEATAVVHAEAIRAALGAAAQRMSYPVSFSLGLPVFPTPPRDPAEALVLADRLMYAAKHSGKDRIVVLNANAVGV